MTAENTKTAAKREASRLKKQKPAEVHIRLPDGTRIDAVGPMAEVMARRLMEPQSWVTGTYYPYWSNWNGLRWNAENQVYGNASGTAFLGNIQQQSTQQTAQNKTLDSLQGVSVTSAAGVRTENVTSNDVGAALTQGFGYQPGVGR